MEILRRDIQFLDLGRSRVNTQTLPIGIPHVLIDGRFVIEVGMRTDVLAGGSVWRGRRDR